MLRAKDVVRIHQGHYTVPLEFPRAPHLQGAAIVVTSFFVSHPDGPILLDTGFALGHAKAEALFHPVVRDFDDALREMGVKANEVRAVANCHLHIDHSGNNFRFPGTPIFVQKAERDAAGTTLDYSIPGKTIAFAGATLEVLDGEEAEIARGVRVIPTPGHTDGHQSFVVETQEGRIVVAGQAFNETSDYARALLAWRLDRAGQAHPPYAPWVARLQELDPWRVVFAHDLSIWEQGVSALSLRAKRSDHGLLKTSSCSDSRSAPSRYVFTVSGSLVATSNTTMVPVLISSVPSGRALVIALPSMKVAAPTGELPRRTNPIRGRSSRRVGHIQRIGGVLPSSL